MKKYGDVNVWEPSEFIALDWFKDKHIIDPNNYKTGKRVTRPKRTYWDVVTAFDTETSRLPGGHGVVYVWQWAFGTKDVVIGRTLDEFKTFCENLIDVIGRDHWIPVYVHNLSYDWQYIKGAYHFIADEVFALDSRKILRADMYGVFELRCSYLHSNCSLKQWTKDLKVEHQKLSGDEYDYDKCRMPWDEITDSEMAYQINDVLAVVECLNTEMARDHDTVVTIPLTSTGYIRRRIYDALAKVPKGYMIAMQPDWETYVALRAAFRGGNTHANYLYSYDVIRKTVHHVDRSSSYPHVMVCRKFPMEKLRPIVPCNMQGINICLGYGMAVLMRLEFVNIRVKNRFEPCPYLAKHKAINVASLVKSFSIKRGDGSYCLEDNGRVRAADHYDGWFTDVDWDIINRQYEWDEVIVKGAYYARYGYLPDPVRELVCELYRDKCRLKGVEDQKVMLVLVKCLLNGIYGCTAQDPAKERWVLTDDGKKLFEADCSNRKADLTRHSKRGFLPLQVGVWVTSWARAELQEAIDMCNHPNEGKTFLYCDTDSVFYMGDVDWHEYNDKRIKESFEMGIWGDDRKGVRHYGGVMENEGDAIEFAMAGSKKYVWREADGKLQITIAGVGKKKGAEELERAGGIEKFVDQEDPMVFKEAGGVECFYVDNYNEYWWVNGHELHVTDSAVLLPSEYSMSETAEYERLLKFGTDFSILDKWRSDMIELKRGQENH